MFDSFSAWTQQLQLIALLAESQGNPLWEVQPERPADSSESSRVSGRASARQRASRILRKPSRT